MDGKIKSGLLALMLALSLGSVACGDDGGSGSGDNAPDLDNNGDNNSNNSDTNGGNNNGSANDGDNTGGSTGDNNNGSTGDDDCVKTPKSSDDFLNSCPPKGVERAEFDNEARLPESYQGPGEPLPDLP